MEFLKKVVGFGKKILSIADKIRTHLYFLEAIEVGFKAFLAHLEKKTTTDEKKA